MTPDESAAHQAAEISARLALARARLGQRFRDADEAAVQHQIARSVAQAGMLRGVQLDNADEPEIVFAPYRADLDEEREPR